jgi:hypothetical protein
MFDQLFRRAATIVRHETAPFAEERARYLDYCELRGDSHSLAISAAIRRPSNCPCRNGTRHRGGAPQQSAGLYRRAVRLCSVPKADSSPTP